MPPEESYDHLLKLYDNTILLLMDDNPDAEELSWKDILVDGFLRKMLDMDPSEMPADVHSFCEEWSLQNGHLLAASAHEHNETTENERERVRKHVERHQSVREMLECLFDWIAERAPKSIPPRIIECALQMYAGEIRLQLGSIARTLYGSEDSEAAGDDEEGDELT